MFSNSPTIRNFNCFQKKGSLESRGIKDTHFDSMLAEQKSLRHAERVWSQLGQQTLGNKSETNALWEFFGKTGLELLTLK